MTVFSNEKRNNCIISRELKKPVLAACFLLVFGFIAADCFAQSQNNDQQRLAGTWVSPDDPEYGFIFRSNMTYSLIDYGEVFESGKWRIIASRNIIIVTDDENEEYECLYLLSNDGRTMALIDTEDFYVEVFVRKE